MRNTKPILIGAIVLFVLLAGVGLYAFFRSPSTSPAADASKLPPAIKFFTISGRTFSVTGDNLGRVELWAVVKGQPRFLGEASLASPGTDGAGETWTFPIPAGLRGATGVFARGYDKKGVLVAKMDLGPADLRKL